MKTFPFALLLLVAGCSTHHFNKVTVSPRPSVIVSDNLTERVRYPEIVMDYHIARYVDPNHPLLMHEAHTVYRVEGLAAWNLHSASGDFILPGSLVAPTNAAFMPALVNDAVIAELNQQHTITRTMRQQTESLNGSLHDFATALSGTRNLAEQNKTLREELSKANSRLDALEAESKQHSFEQSTPDKDNY
jgi:hypothetical protein